MADDTFDPRGLLAELQRHRVEFVVVGAIAAIAQGSPIPTLDLDVTPSRDPENYERLAAALRALRARLRLSDGSDADFPIDARFLAGNESWTLITRLGVLDLVFVPAGTRGFEDLRRDAVESDLGTGAPVLVASLADVIRSKEASNRPKDQAQLPALRQTLEFIRKREQRR